MAKRIDAFASDDGQVFATESQADARNAELRREKHKDALYWTVKEIGQSLPEDHPTKPRRKGGEQWINFVIEHFLIGHERAYVEVIVANWDKIIQAEKEAGLTDDKT